MPSPILTHCEQLRLLAYFFSLSLSVQAIYFQLFSLLYRTDISCIPLTVYP